MENKDLDSIINDCIKELNNLITDKKKINPKNFKINKNPLFDSLNYVTFIISIENSIRKKYKKNINLLDKDEIFKNKTDLIKFLQKMI